MHPRVDVNLINSTTQSFEWTEVFFGENKITFGVLGGSGGVGGGGATYLDYGKPLAERVQVKLVDSNHKTNEYEVSIAGVYDRKKSGTLVFEITPKGIVPHFDPLE